MRSTSRSRSSSCWTIPSGAPPWAPSGAGASRSSSNGVTRRRGCSRPIRRSGEAECVCSRRARARLARTRSCGAARACGAGNPRRDPPAARIGVGFRADRRLAAAQGELPVARFRRQPAGRHTGAAQDHGAASDQLHPGLHLVRGRRPARDRGAQQRRPQHAHRNSVGRRRRQILPLPRLDAGRRVASAHHGVPGARTAFGQYLDRRAQRLAARLACGFETSWSACGFGEQARARDRISLIEVAGRPGVRLRTLPGDREIAGSGAAERADLALSPEATGCVEGREQWWAHSLLFPSDYELPVVTAADSWPWGVVFDFHHTGSTGQANFQVDVADFPPRLRFAISAGPVVSSGAPGSPTRRWEIGPIVKNRWYDFVYHVKWSAHGDGWFDAWVDGKQIVHYLGPTLYAGQGCYLKLANYHTPVGKPVSVVHGHVRRGPTREALGSGALP